MLGLGEMMNSVGVIQNDNIVSDKMNAFYGKIIDGHAPQLSGKALNAYAVAGIDTDHESISFEEANNEIVVDLLNQILAQVKIIAENTRPPRGIFHR